MKDANCYDSFAHFVGNYDEDTRTYDNRLLFVARRLVSDSVTSTSNALHDVDPGT